MSKVGLRQERPQVWGLWAFLRHRRLAEEALRAVSSPWSWSVLFRLMQNLHIHKLWQKVLQTPDFFSEVLGTRWMLYGMVFYRFSRHIIVVCSYMPPTWLFCICCGKVKMGWAFPKSSASKAFFLKLKVATGWRILLVGVNILFSVRILKWWDLEAKKVYYSLPQISGLNLKTNLFYHYTEKLEILWCCESWCDQSRYVHLFYGLAQFVVGVWVV